MVSALVPRDTPGDSVWFTHDRFGLFIHWGLYSLGGKDFALQREEGLTPEAYEGRFLNQFDPDLYDPEAWAEAAADAGMKYVVMVAKHHEGFCLWDSKLTTFTSTNSPAGRDLLAPALDAFRSRGLRTGLYYSLLDWHHPDFTVDMLHPLANGDREALNAGRDMQRYRDYMSGQIEELLTGYGPVDVFWPDYSYDDAAWQRMASDPRNVEAFAEAVKTGWTAFDVTKEPGKGAADWDSEGLLRRIRELQPDVLVNDRMGLAEGYDITTPEQAVPRAWPRVDGEPALWESCETLYGNWGYRPDPLAWKSTEQLITMLIDVVGKGGNLLLNVGPNGRGEFDSKSLDRLRDIGTWMRQHDRSIYGCTAAPDDLYGELPRGAMTTFNPTTNRLYVHLPQWPSQPIVVGGLKDRVAHARMLHDGVELTSPKHPLTLLHAPDPADLWLELPGNRPDVAVPVIELVLKG
jgi:alpha-L-fucosidase